MARDESDAYAFTIPPASRRAQPPSLVCDLLGLTGDAADNVPGVPGVGPKTAVKLLKEYGSLEGILGAAPSMKASKRKQALIDFAELVRTRVRTAHRGRASRLCPSGGGTYGKFR